MASRSFSQRQEVIGLGIASVIITAWLAIHVAAVFFADWTPGDAPLALALIVIQAWLSTGLFIIAHDAMHGSLAPGRPALNRALGRFCLAIYAGLSFNRLLPQHHAHHRAPGTAADPDFDADHPDRLLPWFVRFFRGYYTHAQLVRITLVATAYIVLAGVPLVNIVLFWAVPALIALVQLFVFGTYLPHRQEATAFADHHNARSRSASTATSLLTCFHFGGFHHEHHLKPGVPWWRLPSTALRG
jgi:beta-carotene/zeaxanthin 4-ketolase